MIWIYRQLSKNRFFIIIIFGLQFHIGCKSNLEGELIGAWTVDSFSVRNIDYRFETYGAIVFFRRDGACALPTYTNQKKDCCEWILYNEKIKIEGQNTVFDGKYNIEIYKDSLDNSKLIISNDSVYFSATKMWSM